MVVSLSFHRQRMFSADPWSTIRGNQGWLHCPLLSVSMTRVGINIAIHAQPIRTDGHPLHLERYRDPRHLSLVPKPGSRPHPNSLSLLSFFIICILHPIQKLMPFYSHPFTITRSSRPQLDVGTLHWYTGVNQPYISIESCAMLNYRQYYNTQWWKAKDVAETLGSNITQSFLGQAVSRPAEGAFGGGAYIESQGSLSTFGRSQYPPAYARSIVVGMDLNVIPCIF